MDRRGLQPDDPDCSRLRFVGVEHVEPDSGAFNFNGGSRIGNPRSTTFYFDDRHVIYSKLRPYLNKVATPKFVGRCSTELIPLLPRSGVDREFLAYLLRRRATVEYVLASVTGSRMPRTDMKALMCLPVPFPPLHMQHRIVGVLNRAARIGQWQAQALERLQEFIPTTYVKLFGDPVENPMGWKVAPLGEVCTVVGGGTPRRNNPAYFGGSIPWATPTDITNLRSLTIDTTRETLTEIGLQRSSARIVPAGTVLLTSRATIGSTAIAAVDLATNQGFANLTCKTGLVPEYLACWLRFRREELIRLASGTTFKEISKSAIKKMRVPLPPLDLQQSFASIANRAETVVAQTDVGSQTASALGVSLMDRLLEDRA